MTDYGADAGGRARPCAHVRNLPGAFFEEVSCALYTGRRGSALGRLRADHAGTGVLFVRQGGVQGETATAFRSRSREARA